MGISEDRVELEAWRDKKPIPPWKDGSGWTGRAIQGPNGSWISHPGLPEIGVSYVEAMTNGEVRRYTNKEGAEDLYQIIDHWR